MELGGLSYEQGWIQDSGFGASLMAECARIEASQSTRIFGGVEFGEGLFPYAVGVGSACPTKFAFFHLKMGILVHSLAFLSANLLWF